MAADFNEVREKYSLREIGAHYLQQFKKAGASYTALCPFHDDSNPSFSVFEGKDGVWRYRCFSCHEHGDIIDFVANIERISPNEAVKKITGESDNPLPAVGTFEKKKLRHDNADEWKPIMPVPLDAPAYDPARTYKPDIKQTRDWSSILTRQDAYHDCNGRLMFWVVRLEFKDGKGKACPTVCFCKGPGDKRLWVPKRMPPPYPLMGLDALAAKPEAPVMLVSGEKCKLAMDRMFPDMVTVTWLGGDDAVDKVDWEPLKGRGITYWPDNDVSGRRAMRKVYRHIELNKE